jgi:N utilization substance protein A
MSREILEAMTALAREKGIAPDKLRHALEDALLSAYKKQPGSAKYARVELDPETADYRVIELIVPERLEAHLIVETIDENTTIDPETGEMVEPQDPEIDPVKFEQYKDQIDERDATPEDFGRIAAQTAKQVILQRIREAERDMMYEEYRDRVGELITGIVQQSDNRYTLVQLRERVEALLPRSEQVDGERYDHGSRIKAVIKEVSPSTKGPSIIVSRRDPELIKKLFELEVPEIADRLVEIENVAREPGYRSKIAVVSHQQGVDPVGACVGPRGSRVRMVVSELRGEKIDIIPYNDEPARFVAKALSPARVREVLVDDDARQATVIVPDDQLSLAIGREGQNARLAARLTGWRIDIRSETEFATEEQDDSYGGEEELDGRCHAILTNGRRCPNASLPGSRYCGLDPHQALAEIGSDAVADLSGNGAAAAEEPPEPGDVAVADEPVVEEPVATEETPVADETVGDSADGAVVEDETTGEGADGAVVEDEPAGEGADGAVVEDEPAGEGADGAVVEDEPVGEGADGAVVEDEPVGEGADGAVVEDAPVEAPEPVPAGETPAVESEQPVAGSAADELEPQADAAEPTGEAS